MCSLLIVYLLTKTIRSSFSIFGIRRGIGWAFVSLLLDGSFWQIDLIERPFDLLATGFLRATLSKISKISNKGKTSNIGKASEISMIGKKIKIVKTSKTGKNNKIGKASKIGKTSMLRRQVI